VQRSLGIHRKARHKVLPVLAILMAYVPAVVYVGVVVLTNQLGDQADEAGIVGGADQAAAVSSQLIRDYPAYYTSIIAAIWLLAAFVAPEVLCTDRRTGMLGLYLASPLTRLTYVLSRLAGILAVMCGVTLGPTLLLLVGYSTQGQGPPGPAAWMSTLERVIVAGVGVAAFYTMISLALASVTSRRAAASGAFVVAVVGTGGLIPFLIVNGSQSVAWGMADLVFLPVALTYVVFDQPAPVYELLGVGRFPDWQIWAGIGGWCALCALVIWDRYRRMQVTR
jgi:ABC-type transport system involved in multi-copper enzyme maturation permease subunit